MIALKRRIASYASRSSALSGTSRDSTTGTTLSARPCWTARPSQSEWITDELWLVAQGVAQWTELPLCRTYRGTWSISSSAAIAVGFVQRGLRSTVANTWAWMNSGDATVGHERSAEQGISAEKEAAILGVWDARELDHCG